MAKGRKTGGRKKGTPNQRTAAMANAAAVAQSSGLMPLDFLLSLMRDLNADMAMRVDAAKAAAPYLHPKFGPIEPPKGNDGPHPLVLEGTALDA